MAFEGDAHVEWFEGNFEDYEEDKKRRFGPDALEPKRIKHKNLLDKNKWKFEKEFRQFQFLYSDLE